MFGVDRTKRHMREFCIPIKYYHQSYDIEIVYIYTLTVLELNTFYENAMAVWNNRLWVMITGVVYPF
jgi:hypothetical protein